MINDIYILHYLFIISMKYLFCLHLLYFVFLIQVISLSLSQKKIKTTLEPSFN